MSEIEVHIGDICMVFGIPLSFYYLSFVAVSNVQRWLEKHGPFEAVMDAANVGLFSHKHISLSKVNAVADAIRQSFTSRKWPLIVLHNRHLNGERMKKPGNHKLIEKWKQANSIYATPNGSNDDW